MFKSRVSNVITRGPKHLFRLGFDDGILRERTRIRCQGRHVSLSLREAIGAQRTRLPEHIIELNTVSTFTVTEIIRIQSFPQVPVVLPSLESFKSFSSWSQLPSPLNHWIVGAQNHPFPVASCHEFHVLAWARPASAYQAFPCGGVSCSSLSPYFWLSHSSTSFSKVRLAPLNRMPTKITRIPRITSFTIH